VVMMNPLGPNASRAPAAPKSSSRPALKAQRFPQWRMVNKQDIAPSLSYDWWDFSHVGLLRCNGCNYPEERNRPEPVGRAVRGSPPALTRSLRLQPLRVVVVLGPRWLLLSLRRRTVLLTNHRRPRLRA
jgi:hypothetical protein